MPYTTQGTFTNVSDRASPGGAKKVNAAVFNLLDAGLVEHEERIADTESEITSARGSALTLDARLDTQDTALATLDTRADAIEGGATISDARLVEIASKKSFNSFIITRENTKKRTLEANVTWEDGSSGVYELLYYNPRLKTYDGWRVTHALSGKQVRQPAVIRNAKKKVIEKPAYVVEAIPAIVIRNLVNVSESNSEFGISNAVVTASTVLFAGAVRPSYILNDNTSSQGVVSLHTSIARITGDDYIGSIGVKKQSGTTHFLSFVANYINGTTQVSKQCVVNPRTGAVSAHQMSDAGVVDDGDCWRVWFRDVDSSDNPNMRLRVFPAYNTSGSTSVSGPVIGETEVTGWQLERASSLSAYQKKPI